MITWIFRIIIFLITAVMGRIFWKRSGIEIDEEDRKVEEALRRREEYKLQQQDDASEQEREEVRTKLSRKDVLMSLIEKDKRFEEDDFKQDDEPAGIIMFDEDGKLTIEIQTSSSQIQNDKNVIRLYTDIAKSRCSNLGLFIKALIEDENGNEIDASKYRNLSEMSSNLRKRIIIKVNKGTDDEILDLLYCLTHGYELEELDGDGSYVINGKTVRVVLEGYSPLNFQI